MSKKQNRKKQQRLENKKMKRIIKKNNIKKKETEKQLKLKNIGPEPPREISQVANMNIGQYIQVIKDDPKLVGIVRKIREEKFNQQRLLPSNLLIGQCKIPIESKRKQLLDKIALLVDENIFGRSEMCIQFALLLELALNEIGLEAKTHGGTAEYKKDDGGTFTWNHAWVIVHEEIIIDGNVDTMKENIMVPKGVDPFPYWGKISELPDDRKYESNNQPLESDEDMALWWNELKEWIHSNLK